MKKAFALLLTIMLLVCSALPGVADPIVINENFSMRNGITYLCPMSTVKRVERANGSVPSGVGDGSLNYYTTLAGCDVCLEYWEKTPSVLQEFQYSFYSIADYKTISDSLKANMDNRTILNRCLAYPRKHATHRKTLTEN